MPESKYNKMNADDTQNEAERTQAEPYIPVSSVKKNVIEFLDYQIWGDGLKYLLILLRLPILLKEFTIRKLRGLKNVSSYIFLFLYCHFL